MCVQCCVLSPQIYLHAKYTLDGPWEHVNTPFVKQTFQHFWQIWRLIVELVLLILPEGRLNQQCLLFDVTRPRA